MNGIMNNKLEVMRLETDSLDGDCSNNGGSKMAQPWE